MRIIDRLRYNQLIKNIPVGTPAPKDNPLLKKQLEDTQKQLNLILTKWKFGDAPLKSAQEFLKAFEPWINRQLNQQKELREFLTKNGLGNLEEIKTVNFSNEELTNFLNFHKVKSLTQLENQWKNAEQDYLKQIEELKKTKTAKLSPEDKEKLENYDDLVSDLDEARRNKQTSDEAALSLSEQLKNKQKEVSNKDKALEKLKKEKDQLDKNLNKKLTEKNGLITTLNGEIKQHKEKYTKQGKLLDEEQLECKKLETKIESLETRIAGLEKERKENIKLLKEHNIIEEIDN